MALTPADIARRRFGRDLRLDLDPDRALVITPSGDIAALEGRSNAEAAIRANVVTIQGSMVHRASYGGNLLAHLEGDAGPAGRARARADVHRGVLGDPRVEHVEVTVGPGTPSDAAKEYAVTATLLVRFRGDTEESPLSVYVE